MENLLESEFIPLPGVSIEKLLEALKDVLGELQAKLNGTPSVKHYEIYFYWTNFANTRLEKVLRRDDIDRLISTARHWILAGMGPNVSGNVAELTRIEISQRLLDFERVIGQVESRMKDWKSRQGHLVIPDTNVLLARRDRLAPVRAKRQRGHLCGVASESHHGCSELTVVLLNVVWLPQRLARRRIDSR